MENTLQKRKYGLFAKIIGVFCLTLVLVFASGCSWPDGNDKNSDITMSSRDATVYVGRKITLTAKSAMQITWSSSDNEVATVDGGVVTGVKEGKATITASNGTKMANCEVTVALLPTEGKGAYPDLVWADEFDGSSLDMSKWSYQTGTKDTEYGGSNNDRWGNEELQYYRENNVTVSDGYLNITAKREKMGGMDFTSGRITSRGKFTETYGYYEARIKMPAGKGMWPAFWMLPQPTNTSSSYNIYGGWARNGELDILEVQGTRPEYVCGTVHYGDNYPNNQYTGKEYEFTNSTIEEWHTYAVEWTANYIKWYVDDYCYNTVNNDVYWSAAEAAKNNPSAPFDQPFYILLNLAVDSGKFDPMAKGGPSASFTSATMQVDYVRVYK